ncbi:hypothetical protein BD410DRAFT_838930 [Rickenella mellea]|uniref:Protein kinase domain-containing protein n=1 Tax=Rickenella mellea TaxID=50990 RepID=A0A4Y7Q731_9AGAM|nr:hypothetical protein BD410DRAFT_838930 [Rickenella mellea]
MDIECGDFPAIRLCYYENGNIMDFKKKNAAYSEEMQRKLMYQVALALHSLHSQGLFHGNLRAIYSGKVPYASHRDCPGLVARILKDKLESLTKPAMMDDSLWEIVQKCRLPEESRPTMSKVVRWMQDYAATKSVVIASDVNPVAPSTQHSVAPTFKPVSPRGRRSN